MLIELKRTAVHKYSDGTESVLRVAIITFDDGDKVIHIASESGDSSILVSGPKQLGDLVDALHAVEREIWDSE